MRKLSNRTTATELVVLLFTTEGTGLLIQWVGLLFTTALAIVENLIQVAATRLVHLLFATDS